MYRRSTSLLELLEPKDLVVFHVGDERGVLRGGPDPVYALQQAQVHLVRAQARQVVAVAQGQVEVGGVR